MKSPVTLQQFVEAHQCRFDAIPANRAGYMTPGQIKEVKKAVRFSFITLFIFGLIPLTTGIFVGYDTFFTNTKIEFAPVLASIFCIAFGLLLIWSAFGQRSKSTPVQQSAVAFEEGFIRIEGPGEDSTSHNCEYHIGTKMFEAPEEGSELIDPKQRYRIYYSTEHERMVNIEPIGSSFNKQPLISAQEISAIIGIPVVAEQQPVEDTAVTMSFSNANAQLLVRYNLQLGPVPDMHQQMYVPENQLSCEAYYLPGRMLFVLLPETVLGVTVMFRDSGFDRNRTLQLAQALIKKIDAL